MAMGGNGLKLLKIIGNDLKWPEMAGYFPKWLEIVGHGLNGLKCREMPGNAWKRLEIG